MQTLRQCLLDCDLALLRVIAEQWGIELSTNRHHDVAAELAARMAAPDAQMYLAAALTPDEREALSALLASDGQMPVGAFTRRFGEICLMGPGRLERERPWASPQSTAESLWYNGLIYRAFDEGPGGVQEVIYIPPELRSGLQEGIAAHLHPNEAITLPIAPAPDRIETQAICIADDVCTVLAYAHQHTLQNILPQVLAASDRASGPGEPAGGWEAWRRRHPALMAQLGQPSQDYAEFLTHIAERMQLLRLDEHRLRPAPERATSWLHASSFDQAQALFAAWRDDPTWNELWRVPGLRCEDTGSWRNDPLAARQAVLDFLALAQPGKWYSLDGFIATIKTHRPDFQRPGGDYDGWYIRDAQTGDYLRGFETWDQVDGALLRYLLTGPLNWLGVVQILDGGLGIGDWGAALMGKNEPPPESGDTRFEVTADGIVRVGNARRFERFQLSRVADWLQIEDAAVASPCRRTWIFQITPASLERARYQRIGVERVVKFLEESASQPPPELLVKALYRWKEHGSEVWANQVVMLRVARPELLEQLMNTPATRRLIREPISSTVAAILPEHWPALRQALLEMGILVEGGR